MDIPDIPTSALNILSKTFSDKVKDIYKFYAKLYEPKRLTIFNNTIKEVSSTKGINESDFKKFIEEFDERNCDKDELDVINYFYIVFYKNILEDEELRYSLAAEIFRTSVTDHKEIRKLLELVYANINKSNTEKPPNQIHSPPPDFIGRKKDIEDIIQNFERGVAITGLRGLGGIGKTALAYKVAEDLDSRFPDGKLEVNLMGTSKEPLTPAEAMAQVIHAYDLTLDLPKDEKELEGLYRTILSDKRALLLLDNAESAQQVRKLLPPSTCGVIITSRRMFTLPGLYAKDLGILNPSEACDLLNSISDRIANHADVIAKLCGYLPLALRNAGSLIACTPDLDLIKYIENLHNERSRLEHLGLEDDEQISVESSFNLSYSRLPADTARVFRILSIFPADFDAKAEETVCCDNDHKNLRVLVRWNLVEYQPFKKGTDGRYKLHDLTRIFAASRLEKYDEITVRLSSQVRFAEYYKRYYLKQV